MLLETISLEYHQSLLAAAGPGLDLARTTAMERYPDGYVAVVEGAIPDGENGAYCLVGGRPVKDIVREVASGALAVIAVGSCASDGGAPAASGGLTDAKGIRGLVGDTKLITLPGCPMNVVNLTAVIVHYLTFREWPALDMMGRPLAAYGNLIHNQCERRPHFEFGEFVLSWGDEGAQRGWCLYKVGCKGPEAMGNCPTVRYGDGVSWNIRAGAGCVGCVTTDSWDQMGPAYRRLPSPVPFFPNLTTDMVGAAVVGGVAVVAGVHAVGMSTRYKRRARNARREALASAEAGIAADAAAVGLGRDRAGRWCGRRGPEGGRTGRGCRSGRTRGGRRLAGCRLGRCRLAGCRLGRCRLDRMPARPRPTRAPGTGSAEVARITIDPVSRIGGQLRIDADVTGGRVTGAWSSATMFRGMETVLPGRDPRDAWLLAQRICGTCNGVHAAASVRAVEQALGIQIPTNARLIRNVLTGTLFVRDHVMALYQGSLPDWVDMSAVADRRSRGDLAARRGEQRLAQLRLNVVPRCPGPRRRRHHVATAGTVRLGVARPSGLPPHPRAEPASRGPHARGVRLAGRLHADPDAALGQGGPPADLPGRRDVAGAALGRPDRLEDAAASAGPGPQRARRAERSRASTSCAAW